MLRQRVITAVLLLLVLLLALFHADLRFFQVLSLLLVAVAAWEWGRLNGWHDRSAGWGSGLILIGAWATEAHGWTHNGPAWLWIVGGGLWVVLALGVLRGGVQGWGRVPALLRWGVGLCLLWLAWLAMVLAHRRGINFLLSVMALVWVADIAAYFAGRAFGGRFIHRKLAPAISPSKSWEGVFGGMLGVVLMALLWLAWDQKHAEQSASLHSLLWTRGAVVAVVSWTFLAAMSVAGDLIESLVKRHAGVKDSSRLLPGHGGVLDRVDALLPVLPLAMMLVSWLEAMR